MCLLAGLAKRKIDTFSVGEQERENSHICLINFISGALCKMLKP